MFTTWTGSEHCESGVSPPSDTAQRAKALGDTHNETEPPHGVVAEVDAGWMHPQHTRTALRQLDDLGREPPLDRWRWATAKLQPIGRIALPAEARDALGWSPGETVDVRGRSNRLALVLRCDGAGVALAVDGRGRLYLPVWLRRPDALLVGTRIDRPLVVIAPVGVLDGIGDLLGWDQG